MTQTLFLLWVPVPNHALPQDQAINASKYDVGILSTNDPLLLNGQVNYAPHVALSERLRTLNPYHRTSWWCGGIGAQRPIDPSYHWLRDDFLLHNPTTGEAVQAVEPGRVINLMSKTVCYDLADRYADFLREKGWHGLAFDSYAPNEWASWVRNLSCPNGCVEGPAHTTEWWEEALAQFSSILRWRLSQEGFEVIVNGLAPGEMHGALGLARNRAVACNSGLLFEMGHRAKGNPQYLIDMLAAADLVHAQRAELNWYVLPRIGYLPDCPPPPNESSPQACLDDQRFHFGAYLLSMCPTSRYGMHPYIPYNAWDQNVEPLQLKVHWNDDWHNIRQLGPALGPYFRASDTAWVRHFARGLVVVNPTNGHGIYHWSGVGRLWDRTNGRVIDTRDGGTLMVDPFQSWVIWTG